MSGGLMIHCGAHNVTRNAVDESFTPQGLGRHRPIPHGELVRLTEDTLNEYGFGVEEEAHALMSNGNQYFGFMGIAQEVADDYRLCVGLRNSHDKKFPAGLALGSNVFVCDNLCFSGEQVVKRKHTTEIMAELPGLIGQAVAGLNQMRARLEAQIECYKNVEITDVLAHDIVIKTMDAKVIGPTWVPKVLQEWREPQHAEFAGRSVWSLMNAHTEVLKGKSPRDLTARTMKLHGVLDEVVGL